MPPGCLLLQAGKQVHPWATSSTAEFIGIRTVLVHSELCQVFPGSLIHGHIDQEGLRVQSCHVLCVLSVCTACTLGILVVQKMHVGHQQVPCQLSMSPV